MNTDFLDDIRAALDSPETADRELLADMAAEYAEAVVAVNRRLREIGKLLEKGFRGEALQMAERKPEVLELVGTLDFAELDEWKNLLLALGMEMPPSLKLDLAEQIDAAYVEIRPLEDLLRRHRALALGKAPLDKRIKVLRHLVNRDPNNPGWIQDLESWETSRLKQLSSRAKQARSNHDLTQIREIRQELAANWSVPIPTALSERVSEFGQEIEKKYAREQLGDIAPSLNDALVAQDVEAGRAARDRWNLHITDARLDPLEALAQETSEALDWLDECDAREQKDDEFQNALTDLEAAMDDGVDLATFNRLIFQVERLERPWPAITQNRTYDYRRSLEHSRNVRFRLLATAVIVVLVVFAAATFFLIRQNVIQRQISDAQSELQQLVDNGDYAAAESLYAGFDEFIKRDPAIDSLHSRLQVAVAQQARQRQDFEMALEAAEKGGLDEPDYISLDRATELARSDAQHNEIKRLKNAVSQRQQQLLTERNDAFLAELENHAQDVSEALQLGPNGKTIEQLDQLHLEINFWKQQNTGRIARHPKITAGILAQVDPLLTRLERRKRAIEQSMREQKSVEKITKGLNSPSQYVEQLRSFVKDLPAHPLSVEFQAAIDEINSTDYWEGYRAWQLLLADADWNAAQDDRSAAQRLLQRGGELAKKYPNIWLAETFAEYQPFLESVVARDPVAGVDITKRLLNRLDGFWLKAGMVHFDGNVFYLPKLPEHDRNNDYYLSIDFTQDRRKFRKDKSDYFGSAPHVGLVQNIKQALADVETIGWQAAYENAVTMVLEHASETEVEPLIKLSLLKRLLSACVQGDEFCQRAYQPILDQINAIDLTGVDWIKAVGNVKDTDVNAYQDAKTAATKLLNQLRDDGEFGFAAKAKAAKQGLSSIASPDSDAHQNLEIVGWLFRDQNGNWLVLGIDEELPNQELFCLYAKDPLEKTIQPHAIATVQSGGVRVGELGNLVAGRPVYGILNH